MLKMSSLHGVRYSTRLRLVCKAWNEAFKTLPHRCKLCPSRAEHLQQLQISVPSISSLVLHSKAEKLDIGPLALCTQLSSLEIDVVMGNQQARVRFNVLPPSLKDLRLQSVQVGMSHFGGLIFRNITTLKLQPSGNLVSDMPVILKAFPGLKRCQIDLSLQDSTVLQLRTPDNTVLRLSALQYLEMHCLSLLHEDSFSSALPALCEIKLKKVEMSREFVNMALAKLRNLDTASFIDCSIIGLADDSSTEDSIAPNNNLRSMTFIATHGRYPPRRRGVSAKLLLGLGGSSLEYLSCNFHDYQHIDFSESRLAAQTKICPSEAQYIGRLSGLTRLELVSYTAHLIDLHPLRNLSGLRDLTLIQCSGVEAELLKAAAFANLQRLHIEDTDFTRSALRHPVVLQIRRKMMNPEESSILGDAVCSLPSLQQVSGHSALFDIGMKEALASWHRVACSQRSMSQSQGIRLPKRADLHAWLNPKFL